MRISYHLTFFYVENRIKYLNRIIQETNTYGHVVDIFLHSNETPANILPKLKINTAGKIEVITHSFDPQDPYRLTWKCRPLMASQKNDYDVFIYSEDDILIYKEALDYWIANNNVSDDGYNLGFLRIEFDERSMLMKNGRPCDTTKMYLTDVISRFSPYTFFLRGNEYLINNRNPYCAFWIYSKSEFNKFVNSQYYDIKNIEGYGVSESSAVGLHGMKTKFYKNTILSISNGAIDTKCVIFHQPNNFLRASRGWATLSLKSVFCKNYQEEILRIVENVVTTIVIASEVEIFGEIFETLEEIKRKIEVSSD
jgi:hypothetical protein